MADKDESLIVVYAIFDRDGNMIDHSIRRTAEQCWKDFENHTMCHRNLLRTDDKNYGYSCKKRYLKRKI